MQRKAMTKKIGTGRRQKANHFTRITKNYVFIFADDDASHVGETKATINHGMETMQNLIFNNTFLSDLLSGFDVHT